MLAAGYSSGQQQAPTYNQGQGRGFNMSDLNDVLPQQYHHQDEADRSTSGSSATLHQQSPSPFASQAPMANPGYAMYPPQYGTPYQQLVANTQNYSQSQMSQPSQHIGPSPVQAPFPQHAYYAPQQQQQYLVYPGSYGQVGQTHQGLSSSYPQLFGRGPSQGFGINPMSQQVPDVASIPGRVSQYGGFSPSGSLGYGQNTGAIFGRPGATPGNSNPPCKMT